jgi:glycosyltransferase involved in cell wall biosynthesis
MAEPLPRFRAEAARRSADRRPPGGNSWWAREHLGVICLWTPAPAGSRRGNRITSLRWTRLLRSRGVRVKHTNQARPVEGKILLALHAVKARDVLLQWTRGPRVAVLTGTDLNGEQQKLALDTLQHVDAIVALQPLDRQRLPPALHRKTRVILPSVSLPKNLVWNPGQVRVACSVGHLREVKQPLCLPQALDFAPNWSGLHIGGELEPGWGARLRRYKRFRWAGEMTHFQTLRTLSQCRCFVIASESEGCSNALCEALALGMPVLASDIPGNRGLLGAEFRGYFPVGDARALGGLLEQGPAAEPGYQRLLSPEREADNLQELISLLS